MLWRECSPSSGPLRKIKPRCQLVGAILHQKTPTWMSPLTSYELGLATAITTNF